jgi:Mitochondrial carrier protein
VFHTHSLFTSCCSEVVHSLCRTWQNSHTASMLHRPRIDTPPAVAADMVMNPTATFVTSQPCAHAGSAWGGRPGELEAWQYIAIGGAAGALASLATMPADVLKTRIMTAAAGTAVPNAGGASVPFLTHFLGACLRRPLLIFCISAPLLANATPIKMLPL